MLIIIAKKMNRRCDFWKGSVIEMKHKIIWWKVVLLGAVSLLFLWMLVEMLPTALSAHDSFVRETRRSGLFRVDLFSERAGLYHFYLCMELFNASGAALALYGMIRCFYPVRMPVADADRFLRRWRGVTYFCLVAFSACLLLLFLYSRCTHDVEEYGIANGGDWTTAANLIIPGWLGIALILSMDGVFFSLFQRRELKKATNVTMPQDKPANRRE